MLLGIGYAPVAYEVAEYYSISERQVELLVNWPSILYMCESTSVRPPSSTRPSALHSIRRANWKPQENAHAADVLYGSASRLAAATTRERGSSPAADF